MRVGVLRIMQNKKTKWWLSLLISGIAGTIIGALSNEYLTPQWLWGAILFSPFSLIVRVSASMASIFPNIGISVWTTPIWNAVDISCILSSVILSVFYFRTEKYYFLMAFCVSFAILNSGNMNQFVAMMSI